MTPKAKNILVSVIILTVLPLLGLGSGILVGKNMAYKKSEGRNSSWKILDSTLKFEKIVDASSKYVWARSSDGKLYFYAYRCDDVSECHQWLVTSSVPEYAHTEPESPIVRGATCPDALDFEYLDNPPGILVECVRTIYSGLDLAPGYIVYYALTDDGKIWAWEYSSSMPWLEELVFVVFYSAIFSCSGLFVSIMVVVIFNLLRRKKQAGYRLTSVSRGKGESD